ncbi:MAG: Glycosyltransferase [uncultured Propionibacteriaceae bacterium]|uniref:Glycosyltransferase n=1 Tax=uncultured Propionibacteriaceae bacterium TaxID=257457 RepID=A0A6J4N576_9ACTN|nr:MAG: Glycosyltransferase [uncultured Propionibacteriaceae bacterium]
MGPERRADLLGSAHALLHPIAFAEPFGLSVVESMVTGTPVIAYPRGSMPEVIDDGVTGFLADGVHAAVQAVARVGDLDRRRVRQVAECRYSAARMVDDYVEIYASLLQRDQ